MPRGMGSVTLTDWSCLRESDARRVYGDDDRVDKVELKEVTRGGLDAAHVVEANARREEPLATAGRRTAGSP